MTGPDRLTALVGLVPAAEIIVDVGADHARVARRTGAIAVERGPQIPRAADVPWVLADGLRPFRRVDVAIIAGMGARSIAAILSAGPKPAVAVLHADDEPWTLRRWLKREGWRIEAERLGEQGGRLAELIRATPGEETSDGCRLELGPRLLDSDDPWLGAFLVDRMSMWRTVATLAGTRAPDRASEALRRAAHLAEVLTRRDGRAP